MYTGHTLIRGEKVGSVVSLCNELEYKEMIQAIQKIMNKSKLNSNPGAKGLGQTGKKVQEKLPNPLAQIPSQAHQVEEEEAKLQESWNSNPTNFDSAELQQQQFQQSVKSETYSEEEEMLDGNQDQDQEYQNQGQQGQSDMNGDQLEMKGGFGNEGEDGDSIGLVNPEDLLEVRQVGQLPSLMVYRKLINFPTLAGLRRWGCESCVQDGGWPVQMSLVSRNLS